MLRQRLILKQCLSLNFAFIKKNSLLFSSQIVKKTDDNPAVTETDSKKGTLQKVRYLGKDDDTFWKEYRARMKSKLANIPLESQEIIASKTIHSWEYSKRHSMTSGELIEEIKNIKLTDKAESIPYVVLDIRESSEHLIYKLPIRNSQNGIIPVLYIPLSEINQGNFFDIPKNKYIIIMDTVGLRSRSTSILLTQEGYLPIYIEGGFDYFIPLVEKLGL